MAHPAAEFRRQAAGEAEPQGRIINQHHAQAALAQHQAPAVVEQVLAVEGAVGQGLAAGAVERQGIELGGCPELNHHLGLESLDFGPGLRGDTPGCNAPGQRQFPHQQHTPLAHQALELGQGSQGLPVQPPLQQGGIHLGPAAPGCAARLQPTVPGFRQGGEQAQELTQRRFLLGGQGHQPVGVAGMGEHTAAEAFMQGQQARLRRRAGAPQPVPVRRLKVDRQGLAQLALQPFGLGYHQLALLQMALPPGLQKLAMVEQPEVIPGGGAGPFPAGQRQPRRPQSRPFHPQQPLAQCFVGHEGHRGFGQGEGNQQADQPAGIAAGRELDQGVVGAPQAAAHQPAEGEVVGPGPQSLLPEQGLELLVGGGFQHQSIVGRPFPRSGCRCDNGLPPPRPLPASRPASPA